MLSAVAGTRFYVINNIFLYFFYMLFCAVGAYGDMEDPGQSIENSLNTPNEIVLIYRIALRVKLLAFTKI